jgi:hypothetical protein
MSLGPGFARAFEPEAGLRIQAYVPIAQFKNVTLSQNPLARDEPWISICKLQQGLWNLWKAPLTFQAG